MFYKPNSASGVPIYVQLKEQIKHAIETGALSQGDQLPGLRALAEDLVINPNTVIRVYRELEQEGVLEIRHGVGAFVSAQRRSSAKREGIKSGAQIVRRALDDLRSQGLSENEIRRLFEAELMQHEQLQRR